jgi:hypothetical protein
LQIYEKFVTIQSQKDKKINKNKKKVIWKPYFGIGIQNSVYLCTINFENMTYNSIIRQVESRSAGITGIFGRKEICFCTRIKL